MDEPIIYREQIIEILTRIRSTINDNTDIIWTRYNKPSDILKEIDGYIENLRAGEDTVLTELSVRFGPTGTFQELSIANGWGDAFLVYAEQFDSSLNKLKNPGTNR